MIGNFPKLEKSPMNRPWILPLALVAGCGLAMALLWHSEEVKRAVLEDEVTALHLENGKLTAQAADATEKAEALESESEQLRAARVIGGSRLEPVVPAAAATPAETPQPQGSFLSKMLKDPEMRKMMAAGAMNALRGLYADYLKQANLTQDQTDKFFQILENRQTSLMDSSAELMAGGKPDVNGVTAATDAANDAMQKLLGPQQYQQYEQFEKTLGSRVELQQFSQQLAGEGAPLQDYQSTALLQIISQESASLPQTGSAQGMAMSQEDMNQYAQAVSVMNQRVYNRAMSVLSPQQLAYFASFQKNVSTAQMAGLRLTQRMIKGD